MAEYAALELPEDGKLSQNIAHFARALRRAGLPIGQGLAGSVAASAFLFGGISGRV